MSGPAAVTVVGIGADGWPSLTDAAREALRKAEVVVGGPRQLRLLADCPEVTALLVPYPKPLVEGLPALLGEHSAAALVVLASGDPMMYGVGATLVRTLGADRVHVLPGVSSVSLACAALRWPVEDVDVISVVGRPVEAMHPVVQPGRRVLVLSRDADTPALVAALLVDRGFGSSTMTVLERLGDPAQRRVDGVAREWSHPAGHLLNVVAVECRPDVGAVVLSRLPGLPDEAYDHDGQLTKKDVRAVTLARLAPSPGQLLWDVGAGAGSVGIEWMRAHPACRAIAIEDKTVRSVRIRRNAEALGVPGLEVVIGRAPEALTGLPTPDAVFVGGGASRPGVLDACWASLPTGGRLVVNGVTLETEGVLIDWHRRRGGELVRLAVSQVKPVGTMLGWSAAAPVTQWMSIKGEGDG